jgi:hypothetical protein
VLDFQDRLHWISGHLLSPSAIPRGAPAMRSSKSRLIFNGPHHWLLRLARIRHSLLHRDRRKRRS